MRKLATLALLLMCAAAGCGNDDTSDAGSTETGDESAALVTSDSAERALREAGFRVSLSPVPTGSGIEAIVFVDVTPDVRVEVAIFGAQDAAERYAQGAKESNPSPTLVRNCLIFLTDGVSSDDQARVEMALRKA